jgi:hypothetical protein
MARSTDGGRTWFESEILHTPQPTTVCTSTSEHSTYYELGNSYFPDAAADRAGNVYVVFSTRQPGTPRAQQSHIMLMSSRDHGRSFTGPNTVDWGLPSNTAPAIAAGDAGVVDITWTGSTARDETSATARWAVMFGQTVDATAAVPHFQQVRVSPLVHIGSLCPTENGGDDCSADGGATGTHVEQHEIGSITADECGNALLVGFVDSTPQDSANTSNERVQVWRQTKGRRLTRRSVPACTR